MSALRILISSPVCQKPRILAAFLESLAALEDGGHSFDFCFVDDNQLPQSSEMLRAFSRAGSDVTLLHSAGRGAGYNVDEHTHYWRDDIIMRVAANKNRILDMAADAGYDAVFLVDSDILLQPRTIVHLAGLGRAIVSEVFWTQWQPGTIEMPNVWLYDTYGFAPGTFSQEEQARAMYEFMTKLRIPGVYRVGGLGACTLINTKKLPSQLRFLPIGNLTLWGEDRWFCVRADVLGLELWADTALPPRHIYRESMLE
jgi:hypothetical protein